MKKTINNSGELTRRIAELELQASSQKREIEQGFKDVSEGLKPMNIIKGGFKNVFAGEHKGDLFNALLGLGSGFLGRKLLLGKSSGFVGKTVGKAIQWGMAGLVSKNADRIKEKAGSLIDKIFKKPKSDLHTGGIDRSTTYVKPAAKNFNQDPLLPSSKPK